MFRQKASTENEPNSKERNINGNEDPNEADTVEPVAEQSPDIYKLPVELMLEIFNNLALEDLNSVCKTSKWWKKVADSCFQQDQNGFSFLLSRYAIILFNHRSERYRWGNNVPHDAFNPLVQKISVCGTFELQKILDHKFEFYQLREIWLARIDLRKIHGLGQILKKIERLYIEWCEIQSNLAQHIFECSPNLNHFRLINNSILTTTEIGTEWLLRKYPSLDRFEINSTEVLPITTFLELNPNIRRLGMNSANLLDNRDSIKASKINLDDLSVSIDCTESLTYYKSDHTVNTIFASICSLLNELFELGIYKRLKLYVICGFKQEMVDEIASLKALVKLYTHHTVEGSFALSTLRSLEEFRVECSHHINDIEAMAGKLDKLKLMHMREADINSIMPFIRHAKKMEKIYIDHLFGHEDINLTTMNRARLKLPNAKKITLYVREHVFLAAKRTQLEINLDFIKLKRIESFEWDHDFNSIRYHED